MCLYHYVYWSKCQHADFYMISPCDKAKALGLPTQYALANPHYLLVSAKSTSNSNNHSRSSNTRVDTTASSPGRSSSQPSASTTKHKQHPQSQLHSHQHHQNMCDVPAPYSTGLSVSQAAASSRPNELMPAAGLIPRAVPGKHMHSQQHERSPPVSLKLGMQELHSLDSHTKSERQSCIPTETTHDGKAAKVTTPSEVRVNVDEADAYRVLRGTASHEHENFTHTSFINEAASSPRANSIRKSIPSQWLPPSRGPKLATAQRARERRHKKEPASSTPMELKTIRGTRSLADLGRLHGATEGATFLTKEALAAVDKSITTPVSARSPTKYKKPAWHSPSTSPLREAAYQSPSMNLKVSPTRTMLLGVDGASSSSKHGSSSVATSAGDTVFYDTHGSPVRSTADSDHSFQSAEEYIDDFPHLFESSEPYTDPYVKQTIQKSAIAKNPAARAATMGRAGRPKLSLQIPLAASSDGLDDSASAASTLVNSSTGASHSPHSAASVSSTSRIPRAAPSTTVFIQDPSRVSTLERRPSSKSVRGWNKMQQARLPAHLARTINNVNMTHNMSRDDIVDDAAPETSLAGVVQGEISVDQAIPQLVARPSSPEQQLVPVMQRQSSMVGHKISSVLQADEDPALMDPAIIYSRKRSDASDTFQPRQNQNDAASLASTGRTISTHSPSPPRGTSAGHISSDSVDSPRSSRTSELRATAPDFVPQTKQASNGGAAELSVPPPADSSIYAWGPPPYGPPPYGFDMYSSQWFLKSQLEFAYFQGYTNGQVSKPNRKFRHRKQPSSKSASTSHGRSAVTALSNSIADESSTPCRDLQHDSDTLTPNLTVVSEKQRSQGQSQSNASTAGEHSQSDSTSPSSRRDPFANQIQLINRHSALGDTTNVARNAAIDITTIRNVHVPSAPRNMRSQVNGNYSTISNRGYYHHVHQNGRRNHNHSDNGLYTYGNYGYAGVPLESLPFPPPVPPPGRPNPAHGQIFGGYNPTSHASPSAGPCGLITVGAASEVGGGQACNTCEPDHPLKWRS